jgi:glycosyltransferase involved in cell wall biosynthesis
VAETLTVVVPTKNNEDIIERCLESIKWADEIVIVDGYSSDDTLDICRRYTDKIVQNRFNGNFDIERNLGIDNSTGDWILQLDSDEVVTPEMREAVEKILRSGSDFSAYKFKRKNYFLGHPMRYGGWYHDSLHFLRRGKARYKGKIHETLIVEGKIGQINADVEHYPYSSISQFIARQDGYSTREAQYIYEKRGVVPKKEIMYNLRIKPLKLFWKFFIKKQGFREEKYGLIFSILYAWVHFINWAKYWELIKEKGLWENSK